MCNHIGNDGGSKWPPPTPLWVNLLLYIARSSNWGLTPRPLLQDGFVREKTRDIMFCHEMNTGSGAESPRSICHLLYTWLAGHRHDRKVQAGRSFFHPTSHCAQSVKSMTWCFWMTIMTLLGHLCGCPERPFFKVQFENKMAALPMADSEIVICYSVLNLEWISYVILADRQRRKWVRSTAILFSL